MNWRPGANVGLLRERAALLADIREFFARHDILEVETPVLAQRGVTDPAIEPLIVGGGQSLAGERYLQSSPEYHMKRLLAAGSGPIYQLSRCFRDGEAGSRHNPEFTLLEWYRPGFTLEALMDEVAGLVRACLGELPVHHHSYRELFLEFVGIDPFTATLDALRERAREHIDTGAMVGERDLWLDLLVSHVIEPRLTGSGVVFVHDYPASQAALARIADVDGRQVGRRFEVYVDGIEIANGYHELADSDEQRQRFERDNAVRRERGQPERPVDEALLAALSQGLPDCSGVALGVDRLLMRRAGVDDIREVLAFDWDRA